MLWFRITLLRIHKWNESVSPTCFRNFNFSSAKYYYDGFLLIIFIFCRTKKFGYRYYPLLIPLPHRISTYQLCVFTPTTVSSWENFLIFIFRQAKSPSYLTRFTKQRPFVVLSYLIFDLITFCSVAITFRVIGFECSCNGLAESHPPDSEGVCITSHCLHLLGFG